MQLTTAVSAVDLAYAEKTLEAVPKGARKAIISALNQTMRSAEKTLANDIQETLNLRDRDIKSNISRRVDLSVPAGILTIKYRKVPLEDFRARFSKRSGVTVTTIKPQGKKHYRHFFRQTMASGHVGIFKRDINKPKSAPSKGTYAGRKIKRGSRKGQLLLRQAIEETYGPAVTTAFELTPGVADRAMAQMASTFHDRLMHNIDWQLTKANPNIP